MRRTTNNPTPSSAPRSTRPSALADDIVGAAVATWRWPLKLARRLMNYPKLTDDGRRQVARHLPGPDRQAQGRPRARHGRGRHQPPPSSSGKSTRPARRRPGPARRSREACEEEPYPFRPSAGRLYDLIGSIAYHLDRHRHGKSRRHGQDRDREAEHPSAAATTRKAPRHTPAEHQHCHRCAGHGRRAARGRARSGRTAAGRPRSTVGNRRPFHVHSLCINRTTGQQTLSLARADMCARERERTHTHIYIRLSEARPADASLSGIYQIVRPSG